MLVTVFVACDQTTADPSVIGVPTGIVEVAGQGVRSQHPTIVKGSHQPL